MSFFTLAQLLLVFGVHNHQCECEEPMPITAQKAGAETLIISEIMQNPSAVADSDGEWFEVYNPGVTPVNMNGWTIRDNDTDSHTITSDVLVPAGGYAVLGNNSNPATNGGLTIDYQYASFNLANGADEVVLVCPDTTIADTAAYDGGATWPDPSGASMELSTVAVDNNLGANWAAATTTMSNGDNGTPGTGPDFAPPAPADPIITEIFQNPSAVADAAGEWFEVHNPGSIDINLNGWTVRDNDTDSHTISTDVIIPGGAFVVLGVNADSAVNGGINVTYQYSGVTLANGADEVVLVDPQGTIIDEVAYDGGAVWPDPTGSSMELNSPDNDNNLGANWAASTTAMSNGDNATPGTGPGGAPPVAADPVITEVFQNPNAVSDAVGEWFEIHNPGGVDINLNGWTVRDNGTDSHTISTDVIIAPGAFVVLAINADSAVNGGINAAYQYSGITLANGADEVVLVDPQGTVVDEVAYDGGVVWPNPTGASMELNNPDNDNNLGANWAASTTTMSNGDNATPGSGPSGDGGGNPPTGNQAPVVNAGSDNSFTYDGTDVVTTLTGTATDADNDPLTVSWSLISGDAANVTISSPTTVSTGVTITAVGFYTFELSANDGTVSTTDTASINVRTTPSSSGNYNVYFGNLHSHSSYSDGNKDNNPNTAGVAVALRYARDNAGLDWYMVADHNHATAGMALVDYQSGVQETNTVNAESTNFVGIYGMEWGTISTGGHVIMDSDTLWGWEAGNYDVFVEKGDYTALFQQIVTNNSLGHLCHPRTDQFDNIFNIPYNAAFDNAISSVSIKSGPAFATETDLSNPSTGSYMSRYTDLLLKGYHLGPGADQDTHYANWGLANQQRTAILATDLTKASVMEALRAGRVYAVEDRNIVVDYSATFNNTAYAMSTILQVPVGQNVTFDLDVTDPDGEATSSIELFHGTVGGSISTTATANGSTLTFNYSPAVEGVNNFFYAVITQADGQKATTAPVWVESITGQTPSNVAPTAAFTSSASDLSATFTDGSSDSDGSISSRSWDFGDGASSTATNPSHTYAAAGSYTVTLTVTDNEGATDSTSSVVTVTAPPVPNQAPTAAFSSSGTDLSVTFTDSSSDSDGSISSRSWDFGDGNASAAVNPSHTYAAAGSYTVTLTVTDNDGANDTTTATVTVTAPPVPNQAPTAAFSSSVTDLTATFTDSSSDSDGSISSRSWDFGDGNASTAVNPTHTYASAGSYTVTLTVTDNEGATDSTSASVTVTAPPVPNQAPTAAFSSSVTDLTATFTDGSSDSDGSISSRSWDFGDGNTSTAVNPTHTYASAGSYTVTLTVTDNEGATDSTSASVTVTAPPTGTNEATVTGALTGRQSDYWEIDVTGGVIDLLLLWDTNKDLDLYIYDPNGDLVAFSESSNDPETLVYDTNGVAGTYTIEVYVYNRTKKTTNYVLDLIWQ